MSISSQFILFCRILHQMIYSLNKSICESLCVSLGKCFTISLVKNKNDKEYCSTVGFKVWVIHKRGWGTSYIMVPVYTAGIGLLFQLSKISMGRKCSNFIYQWVPWDCLSCDISIDHISTSLYILFYDYVII